MVTARKLRYRPRYLFTANSLFTIKGRGIAVLPGLVDFGAVRAGDMIELRRPDGSSVRTKVTGVEYPHATIWLGKRPDEVRCSVLLGPEVTRADVPDGTEVWAITGSEWTQSPRT